MRCSVTASGRTNHRPPVAVPLLETLRIHALELLEATTYNPEERRGLVVTRAVELARLREAASACFAGGAGTRVRLHFGAAELRQAIVADGMTRSPGGNPYARNKEIKRRAAKSRLYVINGNKQALTGLSGISSDNRENATSQIKCDGRQCATKLYKR